MFIQRVKEDENELSGTRCDAVRSILFREDGGGICLTIKDIDDEWKNLYENIQVSIIKVFYDHC